MKFNDQELRLISNIATIEAIMKELSTNRAKASDSHRRWLHKMWLDCRDIAMRIDAHFHRREWMATSYAMAGGMEWPRG